MPILAFAGAFACGPMVENEQRTTETNVKSLSLPGCGHFPAEETLEALRKALIDFFGN